MRLLQLLISSFLLVFFAFHLKASPSDDNLEFVGTIQLSDKSLITYKISFVENEDGTLTGKSITDFAGDHRTESRIKGRINRDKNLISFSELENTYTKSDSDAQDFCYIHLHNAKLKLGKKKSIIQGHFYSRYADGSLCIEGDIYLMGEKQFLRRIEKVEKTKDRAQKLVAKENIDKVQQQLDNTKVAVDQTLLSEEESMTLRTKGNEITIKVWDAEYIDGDMISIRKETDYLLRRYSIKREPKEMVLAMDQDSVRLTFIANNEGKRPPNSANIEIVTSEGGVPFKLQLNKDKAAEILILKDR